MSERKSIRDPQDRHSPEDADASSLVENLWSALDCFRGYFPTDQYAKPVLELLLLTEANRQRVVAEAKSETQAIRISCPTKATFEYLLSIPDDRLGETLTWAFRKLIDENPALRPVEFSDFSNSKFPTGSLRLILQHLSLLVPSADETTVPRMFEAMLERFAEVSRHPSESLATPKDVRELLIALLNPDVGMSLYDPCAGTAGLLIEGLIQVRRSRGKGSLALYGQEVNPEAFRIGTMNLFLRGAENFSLALGNTLTRPIHVTDGGTMRFDRVVSYPPFTVPLHRMNLEHDQFNRFCYGIPTNNIGDFAFIQHMLKSLKPHGIMATIVSHGVLFRGGSEKEIRRQIIEDDVIEAVIGLPQGLLQGIALSTAVLVLNRNKPQERRGKILFINADTHYQKGYRRNRLTPEDIEAITGCYNGFAESERFSKVATIDDIRGNDYNLNIRRYADSSALGALVTQYNTFQKVAIKELSLEVKAVRGGATFTDQDNAVYISTSGKRVTHRLDDIDQRHDRFYQVILGDRAINAYVAQFLRTSIGQHALSLMAVGSAKQRLAKAELAECLIALPDLKTQQSIVATHEKLLALRNAISKFDQELSVNPVGLSELQVQLDSMLQVIGQLSDADQVRSIIREGESKTVEFKETFSLNVRNDTGQKDGKMEDMCLKTIVAFLNSEGGHLLVGVADDGSIAGLAAEIGKFHRDSTDKFLLHFKNAIEKRIGPEFYPFINYRLVEVDGKNPMIVQCKPSQKPCFLDGADFYVRTNPATDRLVGPKQLEYIRHRFEA